MINGNFVVDAVVHPYDMSPPNWLVGARRELMEAVHKFHTLFTKEPETWLSQEEYFTDFPNYATAHALFAESQVDVAVLHALPSLGYTAGPVTRLTKMAALRDRWPHRFVLYGNVDSLDTDTAIKTLENQVREYRISGLKFYPALFYDNDVRRWRMDDPNYAIPLLEAARDLGIRNIAIHKAMPWGAPVDWYRIHDMEDPLTRFPDMNFQMVHAGFAFVEDTVIYMRNYKNLYANLETTVAFAGTRPQYFAEVLGEMLYWGLEDQILFASGLNIVHPQPPLAAMASFEMPQDLMEGRGYPAISADTRRKILGGNAVRLHVIDADEVVAATKDDEFELARRDGLRPPWSGMREHADA